MISISDMSMCLRLSLSLLVQAQVSGRNRGQFSTYLGRSDKKNGRPFRFIRNESQATAANVYLLLYPKPALARALATDKSLARKIWIWLNSIKAEELLGHGRVYGGGLHKLEPKELANVPADDIARLAGIAIGPPTKQGDLFVEEVA